MTKTVTIAIHERTVYETPQIELLRSDGRRQLLHRHMRHERPLDCIEISGVGDGLSLTTTIRYVPVTVLRSIDGSPVVLGPPPVPSVHEQARQVQALVNAMGKILAEMGADGTSASSAAKQQALAAFAPFRDDEAESEDDGLGSDWPW